MWVDVVSLRRDGAKLAPNEVRALTPWRARLTVDTVVAAGAPGEPPRRVDVAHLWPHEPGRAQAPLATLEGVQVNRVGGTGLMVVGVEPVRDGAPRPQAWWCRVVLQEASDEAAPEWRHTWPGSMPAPLTDAVPTPAARPRG